MVSLLLVVAGIAALTPIGARMALQEMPPLATGWIRFGIAGMLLAVTCKVTGRRIAIERADRLTLVVAAILCVPINQIGFLGGIKLANASHAGLFYALTPVLVFWGTLLAGRVSWRGSMFTATVLSVAGAVAVVFPGVRDSMGPDAISGSMLAGDGLLFVAVASWAGFVVVSQSLVVKYGPLQTLTAVFVLGTLLDTPLMLVDVGQLDLSRLGRQAWAGFAFITLMTGYVNYLLWYTLIARHDITRVAVVINIHFLLTVLLEHLIFDEPVPKSMMAGCALTLGGVYLATRPGVAVGRSMSRPTQT
ncbi:MAG: DMT family transporter [Phycisphaerae bacterium]